MKKLSTTVSLYLSAILAFGLLSCSTKSDVKQPNSPTVLTETPPALTSLSDTLSQLKLYKGAYKDLIPNSWYTDFEGATDLFTDSCEKQDLIFVPEGKMIIPPTKGSGLPTFPSGTIFSKTFYYYIDKRNPSLGRKIIETRVILFANNVWQGKTYAWNDDQTNGFAVPNGKSIDVSWIDLTGKSHQLAFKISNQVQCNMCHKNPYTDEFLPIGFQMKNLNTTRISAPYVNQITYFQQQGKMSSANPLLFDSVPKKNDTSKPLEKRVRGYLSSNCAYCHSPSGSAWESTDLNFTYEIPLDSTKMVSRKANILKRMRSTVSGYQMPKVHSTLIDYQSINMIEQYFNTLP